MNTIGLDFNGVGNHEFDEGTMELMRMRNGGCHPVDGCQLGSTFMGSQFEFLAANVTVAVTGQPILPAFEVRDVGGAKIAIVGLTLRDTPATTVASLIPELAFADEVASVRALEPAIQAAGAKSIVVLAHVSGGIPALPPTCGSLTGPIVDLADRLPDSVVMVQGAHSHAVYNCKRGTKLVTSAGSSGALVTVADFQIDLANQTVVSSSAENVTVGADPPDPAVQALLDRYDRLVAPLRDRVIGTITTDIVAAAPATGEQPMGDVIADAMLAGSRSAGAMAALMNPGGVRASLAFARSGAETADGQVTYGEAFAVQPFSNTVTTLTATGTEVAAALSAGVARGKPFQVSGLTYTWQLTTPPRVDVADVTIAGSPIVATATYRITVNSIGDADFPAATDRIGLGVDLDLLISYLTANSPLSPPPGGRISLR
jgi:5'-nucleotidase